MPLASRPEARHRRRLRRRRLLHHQAGTPLANRPGAHRRIVSPNHHHNHVKNARLKKNFFDDVVRRKRHIGARWKKECDVMRNNDMPNKNNDASSANVESHAVYS